MKCTFTLIMKDEKATVVGNFTVDVDWLKLDPDMDVTNFTPARAGLREFMVEDELGRTMRHPSS